MKGGPPFQGRPPTGAVRVLRVDGRDDLVLGGVGGLGFVGPPPREIRRKDSAGSGIARWLGGR